MAGAGAIHLLVFRVECCLDAGSVALFKAAVGDLHRDLVHLSSIAHVKRTPKRHVFDWESLTVHHFAECHLDVLDFLVKRIHVNRSEQVARDHLGVYDIRRRNAEGRKHRADRKNVDTTDAEFRPVARGMDRPCTTEGVDDIFLRDVTCTHDLTADQIRHLAVDHVVDASRCFDRRELERPRDLTLDRVFRGLPVEFASPTKEVIRIDIAENDIGVCYGHLSAAHAVADGPGISPGAVGTDQKPSGQRIDTGNGASTRADRLHVDHRLQ